MASRTKETRSSSSGGSGTRKGIAASRILFFARTSCRRDEKRRCNSCGINPKNRLQHQRCLRGGINRRVRTDEKKFQSFVGEIFLCCCDARCFLRDLL